MKVYVKIKNAFSNDDFLSGFFLGAAISNIAGVTITLILIAAL